jgi:HEAT repeats
MAGSALTESGESRITFSASAAERFSSPLGAGKGPLAAREVQDEALRFWRWSGEEGVRWLIHRLRDEFHLETLHGVASPLADLGEFILAPVFEELSRGAARDQALCLLWALDSLIESDPSLQLEAPEAELALADLLQNDDSDVREAAAEAMRLLRPERAVRWLEHRLRDETDAEVRQTIQRELTRLHAGRS